MDVDESLVVRDAKGIPRIFLMAHERLSSIVIAGNDKSELVMEVDGISSRIRFRRSNGSDTAVIASTEQAVSIVGFDTAGKNLFAFKFELEKLVGALTVFDISGKVKRVQQVTLE